MAVPLKLSKKWAEEGREMAQDLAVGGDEFTAYLERISLREKRIPINRETAFRQQDIRAERPQMEQIAEAPNRETNIKFHFHPFNEKEDRMDEITRQFEKRARITDGTFVQLKLLQAGDCVQVLECRSERKTLILIKIAHVTTNDALAVYVDKNNECKTSYLFSACVVSKDLAVVKVLVIPSEEKTRQFVCYVRSTLPNGDVSNKEHYINVTNNNVSSASVTSTGTSAMGIATVSPNTNSIDAGVFAGVLVLLMLVMVATIGLLYFHSKKRFRTLNFGSEQRSIISDDGGNKSQCEGAISYRAKQVRTRGLTMPTRPSVFSSPPPTSLAPEVPGNSSVMRYHKSLDRGSKTLSALTDKFKSPSDNYDVIGFLKDFRCPVIESGISSYTEAFSSGAKFADDNSTLSSARLSPEWRESRDDFGISMERKLCKPQPESSMMIFPAGDSRSRMDSEPASKYQAPWELP